MYFEEQKRDEEYDFEDVLATLVNHFTCPAYIKDTFSEYKGKQAKKHLTFTQAMDTYQRMSKIIAKRDKHPVASMALLASSSDYSITPDAVMIHDRDDKTDTLLVQRNGIYADTLKESTRAATANVLSYVFTPATHVPAERVEVNSNFSVDMRAHAVPQIVDHAVVGSDWSVRADKNRDLVYEKTKTTGGLGYMRKMNQVMLAAGASLKMDLRGPSLIQDINSIKPYAPVLLSPNTTVAAYQFLAKHRSIRGEDKKGLSPLTAGYYLGAIPRCIESVWNKVVDIKNVAMELKVSMIVLNGLSLPVALSLERHKYAIVSLVSSPSEASSREKVRRFVDTGADGIIRILAPTFFNMDLRKHDILYVTAGIRASSVLVRNEVQIPAAMTTTIEGLNAVRVKYRMTWVAIVPEWMEKNAKKQYGYAPSVAAHSGQMILVQGVSLPDSLYTKNVQTGAWHLSRMTAANIYKTNFPLSRTRFFEKDISRYKNVYSGSMLTYIRMSVPKKSSDGIDMVLEEEGKATDLVDDNSWDGTLPPERQSVVTRDPSIKYPDLLPSAPPMDPQARQRIGEMLYGENQDVDGRPLPVAGDEPPTDLTAAVDGMGAAGDENWDLPE